MLGLPGLSFKDPDYYATHLFAHILGGGLTSRLWHEVRETRGLAYSIDSFHWPFSDCGLFGIGAGTAGSDVRELMDVTLDCMVQATQDISEIELIRAKAQMKVALLTALETPGGRIERVARQLLSWGRVISSEEIVQKVDALEVEHVREAGRRLLQGAPDPGGHRPDQGPAVPRRNSLGSARLRFCAAPLPRSTVDPPQSRRKRAPLPRWQQ